MDQYVDLLAAKADALPAGDPTDPANALGPLIDEGQRDKVHAMVTGATTTAPGSPPGGATTA